jgi:hypothetical protein
MYGKCDKCKKEIIDVNAKGFAKGLYVSLLQLLLDSPSILCSVYVDFLC